MAYAESAQDEHEGKLIQHLGIISGICKQCRLADLIDDRITQTKRKVSVGQAVVAMILNALGQSGCALYLTKRFFVNHPVDVLIGAGIRAEDLHDSSLGTALDAHYDYGITELFSTIATSMLEERNLDALRSSGFHHLQPPRRIQQ